MFWFKRKTRAPQVGDRYAEIRKYPDPWEQEQYNNHPHVIQVTEVKSDWMKYVTVQNGPNSSYFGEARCRFADILQNYQLVGHGEVAQSQLLVANMRYEFDQWWKGPHGGFTNRSGWFVTTEQAAWAAWLMARGVCLGKNEVNEPHPLEIITIQPNRGGK